MHLKVNAARFKEEVINMNTESVTEARKRNTEQVKKQQNVMIREKENTHNSKWTRK